MVRYEVSERRARLVVRHRLGALSRAGDATDVARSLVALHATDPATVFLSVRARTDGVDPASIEHALYEERSLIRVLAMRRTLWVVPRETLPVVFSGATRTVAVRERARLERIVRDSGVSRPRVWLARAGNAAVAAVAERGEATTSELVRAVPLLARKLRVGAGTRWETTQSAGARILPQLAMEGQLVRARPRGTWVSSRFGWTTTERWLGRPIEPLEPAAARASLTRRWLAAFAPATETDLRWWAGWTVREARSALAAVSAVAVGVSGASGYVLPDDLEPTGSPGPVAALLPTLDPTTMGWKERDWYMGPHERTLFDSNGNAGPTIWWEGRVVGGWSRRADGEIVLGLLEDVGADAVAAIEAEAARIASWLGDVRLPPGFMPPFQRTLAA